MVDGPYVALPVEQAVPALSVGIIGDQVENRDAPQGIAVTGLLEKAEIVLVHQYVHAILQ